MSTDLTRAARRWSHGSVRTVRSAPGALVELPAIVGGLVPVAAEVLLTCDTTLASGPEVTRVRGLLRARQRVRERVVAPGAHGDVVLDEPTVQAAVAAASGVAGVVVVGSGTMTDLAKLVAAAHGVPLVVVQTAASVNGFADPLSVVVRAGAKRTVSSVWPSALVVDHDVLAAAPPRCARAGVGDAAAVWSAPADWYLACALGMDGPFDAGVVAPVLAAADALRAGPDAPGATGALVDTLTLGGLVLGGVGSTAPLSGVEHLVSHVLDMRAIATGSRHDRHGAQVGVATVVTAALWQVALDELDVLGGDLAACRFDDGLHEQVLATWRDVDPSGELGAECWRAVQAKAQRWASAGPAIASFAAERAHHEAALRCWAAPPQLPADVLAAWGAPTRFAELDPAVPADPVRTTLLALPYLRDRMTVADLLLVVGRWDLAVVDRVLEVAGTCGGGL